MMHKGKFQFVLFVCALLSLVLLFASTSSGNDNDFYPSDILENWYYETFGTVPYLASAIAFDSEDNLYATNLVQELSTDYITVYKYNAPDYNLSNPSIYTSYLKTFDTTSGIDFDEKGNLFVSEIVQSDNTTSTFSNAGLIRKISAKYLKLSDPIIFAGIPDLTGGPTGQNFRPTGIAATGNQTVYFPGRRWEDPDWGNIYVIESFKKYVPGTEPSVVADHLSMYAIADDNWGQIFVAKYGIFARNPFTNEVIPIAQFDPPKYVEEMAFDSEGNLYALEGDDDPGPYQVEILKITPPHIMISECDTGIIDWPGSTITQEIEACATIASHDGFVGCVVAIANELRQSGTITVEQMVSIITCAAQANLP